MKSSTLRDAFVAVAFLLVAVFTSHLKLAVADDIWGNGRSPTPIPELNLPSFAPVVEQLGAAVVNIQSEYKEEGAESQQLPRQFSFPNDGGEFGSPFDFLQRMPPEMSRKSQSLGSGFVIHPDGYIVTNHHVVDKATKIIVTFKDEKKTYKATLIGSDQKTDLALIKIEHSKKLPVVAIGNSDELRPGDWVLAIGNPFRLGHTATVGIVSAKHRRIPGGKAYDNFIQTDASINPGNSGGPLFNSRGEVVGVNTAIFSPGRMGNGGFNIGIGFAIPINLTKRIITEIKNEGKITRGWLGVYIQPVSEDVAEAMQLSELRGALVADVMAKSPAEKAGFETGDVIVSYDGQPVEENEDLPLMVADTKVGRKVEVEVLRKGKKKTLEVEIQELTDQEEESVEAPGTDQESSLGLTVQELTPEIARALGVEEIKGVVVSDVKPDSPAADALLRRGDIVLQVASVPVNSIKQFREVVAEKLKEGRAILLFVRRNKNTLFFTIKP